MREEAQTKYQALSGEDLLADEATFDKGRTKNIDQKPDDTDLFSDEIDQILSNGTVQGLFKKHQITYTERPRKANTQQIVYYVKCPWSEHHTTTENPTDAFISVSRNGMINFRCNHDHCVDKRWKDYKSFFEARDGTMAETNHSKDSKQFDIQLVSGRDLQRKSLPPIVYPVENMIPEGYSVWSAPFKSGKSWLALELCLSIASGTTFLGQKTTKGAAVYLALEDCEKFAQDRLNVVLHGEEAPEGFYYIYEGVPTLDDGLIDYLNQIYEMVSSLKVVVIDVLAKVEYQPKRSETAYKCDYRTGTALKQWADSHAVSLIAITHTTKMIHPNDVFMNTTGTNGVTGSADALLTIAKESRTAKDGVLAITGRRVREKYLKVARVDGYMWQSFGDVDPETMKVDEEKRQQEEQKNNYLNSDIRKAIIQIANNGDNEEIRARDIVERARDMDIFLLDSAKEIGLFIHKNQNLFAVEDGVKAQIIKHGQGASTYRFKMWEKTTKEFKDI